jgi:hypothetical protein
MRPLDTMGRHAVPEAKAGTSAQQAHLSVRAV